MTDQPKPDRPDGDGLLHGLDERLDCLLLTATDGNNFVLSTKSAKNIVGIVREWIRAKVAPTRDGAEGATVEVPHEDCLNCRCAPDERCAGYRTTPPKPAPDAMRDALKPFADIAQFIVEAQRDTRPFIFGVDTVIAQRLTIGHLRNARTAYLSAPVLPADGALDPSNHHNALKCPYCNPQGLSFSSTPGEVVDLFRQAAKLTPREQWYLAETIANCIGQTLVDDPEPDVDASPPVRGDREALQTIADLPMNTAYISEVRKIVRNALSIHVQPGAGEREALLKYLDVFLHPNPQVDLSGVVCRHGLAIEACAARECSNPMAYETAISRARDYISGQTPPSSSEAK